MFGRTDECLHVMSCDNIPNIRHKTLQIDSTGKGLIFHNQSQGMEVMDNLFLFLNRTTPCQCVIN